jgi:hypothetical protein
MSLLDLFTQGGTPWLAFNLARRGPARKVRLGELISCSCGKTFVRTEADPLEPQDCHTCEHDRAHAAARALELDAVAKPSKVAQFSRGKR